MFRWLKSLVGLTDKSLLVVNGYHLESGVRLAHPVTTPLGGRVTLVSFCVNVFYSIDESGTPVVHDVELWQPDATVTDVLATCNTFATRRGEAWRSTRVEPKELLMFAVKTELELEKSGLRRIMLGRWYADTRELVTQTVADLLNKRSDPEEIRTLLATARGGCKLSFDYTKSDGYPSTRSISATSLSGKLLRGHELESGEYNSFHIDRISNARAWRIP